MITIPISFIFLVFMAGIAGAGAGLLFTIVFNFGCDNKTIRRNCIVGSIFGLSLLTCSLLTKFGYIVWK